MTKILSLSLLFAHCSLLLFACTSAQKLVQLVQDPSSRVVTPQTPPLYIKATSDLEQEKFTEAKTEYEHFLTEQPTTPYTMIANYNLARALLGLDQYDEAIQKFRYVATQTSGNAPALQAQALYELSFCYEATGDKTNSLASLLDSYRRKSFFSKEVATAEIPARIAGAYAAMGSFDQAKVYYAQAEDGIKHLKRESSGKQIPEWLPRTLYYMGNVSLRKISFDDVAGLLRPLSKAQMYLLESAELGSSSWSRRASSELIKTYDSTYSVIKSSLEKSGELLSARDAQEKQWQTAQDFFNVLDEMKNYEQPNLQNPLVDDIFKSVFETKAKLTNILNESKIGQDITEDSKARKRPRGKVISPKPELEQDYIRNKKKKALSAPVTAPAAEAVSVPVPAPLQTPKVPEGDPNL